MPSGRRTRPGDAAVGGYHGRIVGPDILIVLIVILVIVLVARGPKMLPRIGEAFGKTVKGVRENVPSAIKDEDPAGDTRERTDS